MRFMLLLIPKGHETDPPDAGRDAGALAALRKYNESLQQAGVLLAGDGLQPLALGARVSFAGGRATVREGPLPAGPEVLGGYWMIQVKSREDALAWASRCPAGDDAVIEVRQVQEFADLPSGPPKVAGGHPEIERKAGR